jgi:hypothetical protein
MSLRARIRSLLRRRGGTLPTPPPLGPDEVRAILSEGGPVTEMSANFQPRRDPYRKPSA